jgi:hypothetical protein
MCSTIQLPICPYRAGVIYILSLAVILPATVYNYDQGDAVQRDQGR